MSIIVPRRRVFHKYSESNRILHIPHVTRHAKATQDVFICRNMHWPSEISLSPRKYTNFCLTSHNSQHSVSTRSAMNPSAHHNSNNEDLPSAGPYASSGFNSQAAAPSAFRSMWSPRVGLYSLPLEPSSSGVMQNEAHVSSTGIIRALSRLSQRSYPHPADFVGRDPLEDAHRLAQAPWFDPVALRNDALISPYVFNGYLPDGISYAVIRSHDWLTNCAFPDNLISRYTNESMDEARNRFTKLIYERLHRFISTVVLTGDWNLDPWMARTNGEGYSYIEALYEANVDDWRCLRDVRDAAFCFRRHLIRAEFRFLHKRDILYWDYPRWERRTRSRLGYLVQYRMIENDRIRRNVRVGRYVALPEPCAEIESPRGCPVDFDPPITYICSALINYQFSGYWTVVFSEFIAKMAAYILSGSYDTYRVWYMSPTAPRYARQLDLCLVLWSCSNFDELLLLVDLIDRIDWHAFPLDQSARCTRTRHRAHSPRRPANAGDFVWYNLWNSHIITSDQARDPRASPRECPSNQCTRYVYESTPSEFADQEYEEAPGADAELDFEDEPELSGTPPVTVALPPTALTLGINPSMGYYHRFAQQPSDTEDPFLARLRQFLLDTGFPEAQLHGDRAALTAMQNHHTSA